MAYDKFLIAPLKTGLQTDLRPWQIMDDAFEELENAYVFRGRVRKRFGGKLTGVSATTPEITNLNSRVSIALTGGADHGITNGAGHATGTIPGAKFKVGQQFSIGDEVFTVNALGVPANMLTTGSATTATFNTDNGDYVFNGAPATAQIYFYPAEPIMGLTLYEQGAIIEHDAYAFDTQFAYKYVGGSWNRIGTAVWHGTDSKFFWASNWEGANTSQIQLFVTNYNAAKTGAPGANDDPMYSFDGADFTAFRPKFLTAGVGNYVQTCRIILPFKDRLILLNTIEANSDATSNSHYPARCRYSHNGVPFPAAPVALAGGVGVGITTGAGNATGTVPGGVGKVGQMFTIGDEVCTVVSNVAGVKVMTTTGASTTHTFNIATGVFNFVAAPINTQIYFFDNGGSAWLEHNQPGWDGAGWIDASTDEEIIGAEFIKDRLIVYFERSTWELAYTGNQVQPFIWQKINTELGSDATFSAVPFDKVILTIGNAGIHACSGANVDRIDTKIPDKIFDIRSDNNGIERICGVRDYYTEMVYWTFPQYGGSNQSVIYPGKVLVYNYKDDSWSLNDDSITCFGYFEQQDDETWINSNYTWDETNDTWTSGVTQADFRQVIAGNQQGYIFIVAPDISRNAAVMQLTDVAYAANNTVLTIENHNLQNGDFILLENGKSAGKAWFELENHIYKVSVLTQHTVSIGDVPITSAYLGGATVTRESRIKIKTKQWNPYIGQGKNIQLNKVDFCVQNTGMLLFVDYFVSSSSQSMVAGADATGALLGINYVECYQYPDMPEEATQNRLWRSLYLQGSGECVQLYITMDDGTMMEYAAGYAHEDFQLEGIILYASPSGRLQ